MYWLSNLKHVSLLLHTSVSLLWNGCNNTQVCSFPIAAQPVTTISHFCKHKCTISRLLWVRRHILVPTYTTLSFARLRSRCQCGTSMFGVLTSERSVSKVTHSHAGKLVLASWLFSKKASSQAWLVSSWHGSWLIPEQVIQEWSRQKLQCLYKADLEVTLYISTIFSQSQKQAWIQCRRGLYKDMNTRR